MEKKLSLGNFRKTADYLRRNGVKQTALAVMERAGKGYCADYRYLPPSGRELNEQRARLWEKPPFFSILVPAYETGEGFLRQLLDSLLAQTYPYWELILADAGSTESTGRILADYGEGRVRYIRLAGNAGISINSNAALGEAAGDYVGLLDHDDFLAPDALYRVAEAIREGEKQGRPYGIVYSDEDKCDGAGERFYEPHFKTKFNLDLLLTNNYLCHFLVIKRELISSLGFRREYDGAQDYDLCLRAVAALWKKNPRVEEEICHIPRVLYHWRCHDGSTAANPRSKAYAYEAGRRAAEDFCRKQGWQAKVGHLPHVGFYRVEYEGGVFAQRKDIGALGGKPVRRGRICGGPCDGEGRPLYGGLRMGFGGYLHRAALAQDADYLTEEGFRLNPALAEEAGAFLESFLAGGAGEGIGRGRAEAALRDGPAFRRQRALCTWLRKRGCRLYWDPQWILRL